MIYEVLFLIGKIILGLFFINSGFNHFKHLSGIAGYAGSKKIPFPKFSVFISGLFMFLGGFSILLGFYQYIGIIFVTIFLLISAFSIHNFWALPQEQKQAEKINFMKNLALSGALLMLMQFQNWPYSISAFLG